MPRYRARAIALSLEEESVVYEFWVYELPLAVRHVESLCDSYILTMGCIVEPGVGVEPTLAIRCGMFTTGCYEPCLQPVALSDRPSVAYANPGLVRPPAKTGTRPPFV